MILEDKLALVAQKKQEAVEIQDYQMAAKLRDEIGRLEHEKR